MADQTKQTAPGKPGHTQGARRLKYGLNVTVAVVAAATLVVLLNWIAYREYVRIDMTASRRYSLSAQTEKLLRQIGQGDKTYELVTLFQPANEHLERIIDLVDEYQRHNQNIQTEHITFSPQAGRLPEDTAFFDRLRERYTDEIAPIQTAIDDGGATLESVMNELAKLRPDLKTITQHQGLEDRQIQETAAILFSAFSQYEGEEGTLAEIHENLDQALDRAMPRYSTAQASLRELFRQMDEQLLSRAIVQFQSGANRQAVPPDVQNMLLQLAERMQEQKAKVEQASRALNNVQSPSRYDRVRNALTTQQSLVVMSPTRVQVIPAVDLYRQTEQAVVESEGEPELQFLGEEKITGALISMQLEQPPMLVFCYSGQQPALGSRGQYTQVAERLRSANFDVRQWNPLGGGRQQMMQGRGGGPAPEPTEGQKAIWVVLPSMPGRAPISMQGSQGEQQILEHVTGRLTEGDNVMFILSPKPGPDMPGMQATDPTAQLLGTWGIEPQLDHLMMREVQVSQTRTQTTQQIEVRSWPDELAITRALAGMPALFVQASPLKLNKPDEMDVQHWPIAQLSGKRVWAEDDLRAESIRSASYDPDQAEASYTVGVAAERAGKRMIVIGDTAWASDPIVSAGQLGGRIVPGLAELTGAAFPGNGELFVNSVYWLAGLDELIAASPRTQDIRRIRVMSETTRMAYQWSLLAGMPALVLLIGMGVWFVRRRG